MMGLRKYSGIPHGVFLLSHIAPVYVVSNKACIEKDCYACAIITWNEEEAEDEANNRENGLVMVIEPKKG